MSLLSRIRSLAFSLLVSPRLARWRRGLRETRRRLAGRGHVARAFLAIDDPYSYLLCRVLPELERAFDIELERFVTDGGGERDHPFRDQQAAYAIIDCRRVAAELGYPFLDRGQAPPVEHRHALAAMLAGAPGSEVDAALESYWRGDAEAVRRRVAGGPGGDEALLGRNRDRLAALGHYATATVHYEGEWYQGLDRLPYLVDRFDALGLRRAGSRTPRVDAVREAARLALPVRPPALARELPVLEVFFSFRSPYSYLALERVFAIADAFGIELRLRPVLPMVQRGVPLSRAKLRYLLADATREAGRLGIPFGRFADPLGAGVERLCAVFVYARAERRARDFVRNAGQAVWARGIDVATDAGLRKVTGRSGLFWPDVVAALGKDAWRAEVGENREALTAAGGWGVPTFRLGEFVAWGQDRCWLLARHLEERCDTGEGILV
ncbi:MAG: DsbA family protein [Woeseiaceae bacterium]|nr:DsbA family protein [Woeseiaceae bacterium]